MTEYVKPRTGMEVITKSAREENDHLTKDDVVIVCVCGDANNIARNVPTKRLKHMTHFVRSRRNTCDDYVYSPKVRLKRSIIMRKPGGECVKQKGCKR